MFDGPNSVLFPGTTTDFLTSPTGLAAALTAGVDLRFRCTVMLGGHPVIIGTVNNANNALIFPNFTAVAGMNVNVVNSTPTARLLSVTAAQLGNPAAGDWRTLRVTYDAATGVATAFTSADNGVGWTQVATATLAAPAALNINSAFPVRSWSTYAGQIAWIDLRTLAGTPVASCDLTQVWPAHTFTDPQNNTWTLNGTGWSWQGPLPGPLAITTTGLPDATVGQPYSTVLAAEGGFPPYTWAVTEGTLPAGLSLDSNTGVISGTPTEPT